MPHGGSPAPNCIVAPVSSGRHSVSVQRMCTECFTYAPRAHSRTAYGACSMTFPHGCGDHHFLYLKKLFRGEAAGTLFHEDETRLTRAGWLRRNASGLLEVTEAVASYFMAARRPVKAEDRKSNSLKSSH